MEARLAKVVATLDHIGKDVADVKSDVRTIRDHARSEFRVLVAAIVAVALGVAGVMAKGFKWL